MTNALTFTSNSFMQCTVSSSANQTGGTIFDVLSATSSVDRRVYGFAIVSADNNANPVKVYLNDGTIDVQVCNVNVAANSGNTTTTKLTDVFSTNLTESIRKTRDSNGIPYLSIPKGWSIRMSYLTTHTIGTEALYTFVFGENY